MRQRSSTVVAFTVVTLAWINVVYHFEEHPVTQTRAGR